MISLIAVRSEDFGKSQLSLLKILTRALEESNQLEERHISWTLVPVEFNFGAANGKGYFQISFEKLFVIL